MEQQLFIGKYKPARKRFNQVMNREFFNKPAGGLWTSTYSKELGSDWIRWCLAGNFRRSPFNGWLIDIEEDTRIYEVDSIQDYAKLLNNYRLDLDKLKIFNKEEVGKFAEGSIFKNLLDFESLAKDFDAIHLTEKGEYITRYGLFNNVGLGLYGWDCESTLHLNYKIKDIKNLGKLYYDRPKLED